MNVEWSLTHKQLEYNGWVLSSVATDDLVLKLQVISIHCTDWMLVILDKFLTEILQLMGTVFENGITCKKN